MKMKIALLAALLWLAATKSYSYTTALPSNNLVQNPYFGSGVADWSGSWVAILNAWSSMPNDNAVLGQDIYQNISTVPGMTYNISFYAAADLYFTPSVTIDLKLNDQLFNAYVTPSYVYNSGENRYDQMHWQDITATYVASSSTTQLEFVDANTYDFGLTTISMVAVPEPTTTAFLAGGAVLGLVLRYRRARQMRP